MRKIKTQREKELYGEMINVESEQYQNMVRGNFIREFEKAFTVFNKIKLSDLDQTVTGLQGDLLRLKGQFEQKLMLVQHVDTGRWFKLPTSEVQIGFIQKRELEALENNSDSSSEDI